MSKVGTLKHDSSVRVLGDHLKSIGSHILFYCGWALFGLSLIGILIAVPPLCGLAYLYGWMNPSLHLPVAICSMLGLPVSLALVFIASWQNYRKPDERLCPHCGYDLRGRHEAAVCPECGQRV
ncbi:MAG: hypothetical protein L0Y44_04765 [Phycisphaerales bacterium]|nr:hypothetical protein [Phycisphaerales bacterium]MCI0629949.1 hypothetical protein [Phycisphaerales bacterium]MCI0675366.1 hypothetical protein [Phycisphaerales bacterium]